MDEARMIPTHALHATDLLVRDIMDHTYPFGGNAVHLEETSIRFF